jgi:cell pole-organizing protein PopZ
MPENAKSPPEPSMEEIIASISRIITEDKKPNEAERAVATQRDDILELTEAVDEDGSVRRVTPLASNPSAASAGSSPPVDAPMVDPDKLVEAGAPGAEAGGNVRPEIGRERILSSATSGAAAAAFAQLGALPRERRREGELPLGGAERTLEDIVRDLLRPLLQTWLDENLPGIVERLVREEITRVVGEAGLI